MTENLLKALLAEMQNMNSKLTSIEARLDAISEGYSLKDVEAAIGRLIGSRGTNLHDLWDVLLDIKINTGS